MGVDYYKILQIDRSANDDDLKKAYLKLGLMEFDDSKFKILSDAFDVLSDPQKRAVYDLELNGDEEGLIAQVPSLGDGSDKYRSNHRSPYGIGLKGQVPPRGVGSDGPNMYRSNRRSPYGIGLKSQVPAQSVGLDWPNMYRFNRWSPYGIGSKGQVPPRGASSDRPNIYSSSGRSTYGVFQEFFGSSWSFGGMEDDMGDFSGSLPKQKEAAIERTLPCSLEDLYFGTTKKMKISRNVADDGTGRPARKEEILMIEIKPGWKKGTKITFSEKGDQKPGVIPSDLVFIIDEKPHSVFKRVGQDLIATQKISLTEASAGYIAHLDTLDGRSLMLAFGSGVSPPYEEVIKGEGMPFSKEPTRKGNLIIKFDIEEAEAALDLPDVEAF
ncbi:uncharacterized protein LOC141705455 [Apium graveolens]|uniref:uncharacterized protein LOC141680853 n=1 Tax=Apium graveolens TaxID=4045 RepID=UPI003D79460D